MPNSPFFSVVIALYNKERYIEATLRSVLNQTFKNFEVIIVNDGSTDKSQQIVKKFDNKKIKLFNIENQGASYARNFGIEKSTADIIAFLDADDLWFNNHLNTLSILIKEHPEAGMYCTGYQNLINQKHYKKSNLRGIPNSYKGIVKNYFECNLFSSIVNSSVVAIPKAILESNGGFDVNIRSGQDTYLWTLIAITHKVAIHNIVTSTIVKNEGSLSNSNLVKDRLLFLEKFAHHETNSLALKKYMDMNRYAVALNFKMNYKDALSKSIFKSINPSNLSFKQKVIYHLPAKLIVFLFNFKKLLDKKGIFLHLYR